MTAEPPSGRAPDAAQIAMMRHWAASSAFARHSWVRELVEIHANCSNLSHAEASRIFEEAREQRQRAEKAGQERDGFASTIAEIRASMKDDTALCASIRGALMAVQDVHPEVPTTHSAAKRVAGALVNVLDNIVLRHVNQESGHGIKTLCQEIWKLRHGGKPGENLDRKTGASRGRAFVNLEKAHIRAKAERDAAREALAASRARTTRLLLVLSDIRLANGHLENCWSLRAKQGCSPECVLVNGALAATRPDNPEGEG